MRRLQARRMPGAGWPMAAALGLWLLTIAVLGGAWWTHGLLVAVGAADAEAWYIAMTLTPAVGGGTLGALVAMRRPDHPVGWLLAGMGFFIALGLLLSAWVKYGALARPGALPAADWLAGFEPGTFHVWLVLAGFVMLLTPDGRLPSPAWRWPARAAAAVAVASLLWPLVVPHPLDGSAIESPIAIHALAPVDFPVFLASVAFVLVWLLATARSLQLRSRRASGEQREQLRWLTLAGRVASGLVLLAITAAWFGLDAVVATAVDLAILLLIGATAASITRYRLYELDRIVSRTVSYGVLTVLLAGLYGVVVIGLGRLVAGRSSLVVAVATLTVAAVFQPLRRSLQTMVDRRFNHRRYDAEHTLEAFSVGLRDEFELDAVSAELLRTIGRTLQPTQTSLWLRTAIR